MLPDELHAYLDGKGTVGQREVLRTLALLSERDGFDRTVKSISEALRWGVEDLDRLVVLHDHIHARHPSDRMSLDNTRLTNLSALPEVCLAP